MTKGLSDSKELIRMFFFNLFLITVSPYEQGIVDKKPVGNAQRGLKLVSKIMQNIANHVHFKEQHMLSFNDFLSANFSDGRRYVSTRLLYYYGRVSADPYPY